MSSSFAAIVSRVERYLADNDFWALWLPIAGPHMAPTLDGLTASEEALWDELYELVYMGQPSAPTALEIADGLVGGAELHERLRQWKERAVAAPAI